MSKYQINTKARFFLFFILIPYSSICQQHNFVLKVHFADPNINTLIIAEAYWRTLKPYHAAKIELDSSNVYKNTYLFKGTILYPTAVRLFSNIDSIKFNELVFIDTGYQEISIIKKDNFYEINTNTPIEEEYRKFLKVMDIKTIDEKMNGERLLLYIEKNPNSYVGLFVVINQAFKYPYPPIFEKINNVFGEKIKQTKAFQYYRNIYSPKTEGPINPDLLGTSIDGKKITLSEFKGKQFVLLDFWASWCQPCLQMIPHLKDLYQKYHSKGLEIISISSDGDKDLWEKTVKTEGLHWINLLSTMYSVKNTNGPALGIKYGVLELPTTILIDKKGNIMNRYSGYSGNDIQSDLDQKLTEIFK